MAQIKSVKGKTAIVSAMTVGETQIVDGVVYVLDIDIATTLGYDRPRKIRDLIRKHYDELE